MLRMHLAQQFAARGVAVMQPSRVFSQLPDQLRIILARLIGDQRCAGMTCTIFDPDLDPDSNLAVWLVGLLGDVVSAARADGREGF